MNTFHKAISLMRRYGKISRSKGTLIFQSTQLPHDAFNALYEAVRRLKWDVKVYGKENSIIFYINTEQ
jgi:hypothetical protein